MKKFLLLFSFAITFYGYGQNVVSKFDATSNGNLVAFLDKSTGNPAAYQWEFQGGNPTASTEKNPKVVYDKAGTYKVTLKVSNAIGLTSVSTRTLNVTITATGTEMDLGTGRNSNGTLMSENGEKDTDWTHIDTKGTKTVPYTRKIPTYIKPQWSSASLGGISNITRWITTDSRAKDYHYYVSKEFEIPIEGLLNIRVLAYVRHWTYLVKKNTDGTETEKEITRTTWMDNGAMGWLNSRSPEVINYKLEKGKYYIKVKIYSSADGDKQSVDVNARVNLGKKINISLSPMADFRANTLISNFGTNIQFTNISGGTPISHTWKFLDEGEYIMDTRRNPLIKFKSVGYHDVELFNDYGKGITSSLKIDKYIKINGIDYTKAPNSYIFDPTSSHNGLFIPVKKAYEMWKNGLHMGGGVIPSGQVSAEVYWEDVHGLIRTKSNKYDLEIIGAGENAKIKVPVNKAKEGNALVVYKVNGAIYWSWHIWVTDDPSNGTNYMAYDKTSRLKNDGTTEIIPKSEWGWMDRNLGAVSNSLTEEGWARSNGLMYQWGRKDPIPPLVTSGWDFYGVSGALPEKSIAHKYSHNTKIPKRIEDKIKWVPISKAKIKDNIRLSVLNPLSLIYVTKENSKEQAYYNKEQTSPINWFGLTSSNDGTIAETNLWSDNSKGKLTDPRHKNIDDAIKPYHDKSSYDPCPNGWRVPSVLTANFSLGEGYSYNRNIPLYFSPFGVKTNDYKGHTITPTNSEMPNYMHNMKIYPHLGADLSNVNGHNIGIFPGTGIILGSHVKEHRYYTDNHEVYLWTATLSREWDRSPAIHPRALRIISDPVRRGNIPAPNYPTIKGVYHYDPMLWEKHSSDAMGVRCIKDPLYIVNEYNFPTEFFTDNSYPTFTNGMDNPNSYQVVKKALETNIKIPINKAFAVQSEHLNNKEILKPVNYNNLKVNVHWTTNKGLIKQVSISKVNPTSLAEINNTFINVKINPNQSGNAVVTLHNGSVNNPVYWSWHIWVTDSEIKSVRYVTAQPNTDAVNYINYVDRGQVIDSEFMDRNLGAIEAFPSVSNPLSPSGAELNKIKISGGLQYQWGRKDPIPSFINPDGSLYSIYLGNTNNNGITSYTELTNTTYDSKYVIPYNQYANNLSTTDKISDKVSKVLSYSVKNPLVFMIPNKKDAPDWLTDDINIAYDRWGRGDKKSPFDPCPEGWRIPDASNVDINVSEVFGRDYGRSPWFRMHTNDTEWNTYKKAGSLGGWEHSISDYMKGNIIKKDRSLPLGYTFRDSKYHIGNYPFMGIRGFIKANNNITHKVNESIMGIWTSAMVSNAAGKSLGMTINRDNNLMSMFDASLYPYFAMNCRCIKIKKTADGKQEGALPRLPIPKYTVAQMAKPLSATTIKDMIKTENNLIVYPNPTTDVLNINGEKNTDYFYQIYDKNGQIRAEGKFINNQINIGHLPSDIYLIRINNSQDAIKIIKK